MNIETVRHHLELRIAAKEILDHILLIGASALTQEIFSFVASQQVRAYRRITPAARTYREGDVAAILTSLRWGSLLYIDELQCLQRPLVPILHTVMQDFRLHLSVGKESQVKYVTLELPRFTLVATTTCPTLLPYEFHTAFNMVYEIDDRPFAIPS
jgi:holliday junction DNA helicase RuvB